MQTYLHDPMQTYLHTPPFFTFDFKGFFILPSILSRDAGKTLTARGVKNNYRAPLGCSQAVSKQVLKPFGELQFKKGVGVSVLIVC
ncbi:hypothetical protein [Pseudoalteromonas sp. MelDa3]|uniref:hypothetical protein n=1 Tax=Pseudoalteromonas sp. MelDa3 TaxID=888435 RepID=UPI000CC44B5D|nr:hypothetical protein [Pseudoalteromonas sp. MelDa3]PLT23819.1 hypothetical protein CXF89_18890 [Pseudoalteromonas sp. MelDa3]